METWSQTQLALARERQERERSWRATSRLTRREGGLRRRVGESVVRLGTWLAAEPVDSPSEPVLSR